MHGTFGAASAPGVQEDHLPTQRGTYHIHSSAKRNQAKANLIGDLRGRSKEFFYL